MNRRIWIGCALVLATAATLSVAKPAEDLVVHEWGTFLSMQGSDGVTLDGMYHEEHALPEFVHARSKDQLRMRAVDVKGETPVIYFYTRQPRNVSVSVGFPQGIWTQWFPQAARVAPGLSQTASPPVPRNGRITWQAQIIPAGGAKPAPVLPTAPKGSLWGYAREVDAAYVRTSASAGPETERYLFYRGLGKATLPVTYAADNQGTVRWDGSQTRSARDLFMIEVRNGKGAWKYVPEVRPGQPVRKAFAALSMPAPLPVFAKQVGDALATRLQSHGLYAKEARAMVNTWRESYFQTEGTRILYVLPQQWTDRFIPLEVHPKPLSTVRVMVGRLEVLTPERELQAEAATRDLSSADLATREKAFGVLRKFGRYAEPVLNRVLATSKDQKVLLLCRRLLSTGFVTELRAGVTSAGEGAVVENPAFVRAQLSSLLREIGLNDEARAEANYALAQLRSLPTLPMDNSQARHPLRAHARMMEGLGDDAGAAAAYRTFITFGAQAYSKKQCVSCHRIFNTEGPKENGWFRDWWAGERFARYAIRTGKAEEVLAAAEKGSGEEANVEKLLAAYIYAARGDSKQAGQLWAALEATPGATRAASLTD
jgi:hypothetical protein